MTIIEMAIKTGPGGYIGRECPKCKKYFKIKLVADIRSSGCYCPYCKHFRHQNDFFTKQQVEHAESVIAHKISKDMLKEMKKMEIMPKRNQFLSLSISTKGKATPIKNYREKELRGRIECKKCTLQYAIHGVDGYCPKCASTTPSDN